MRKNTPLSFNPLFIRSVFLLNYVFQITFNCCFSFNPLFIRSVFLLITFAWNDINLAEFSFNPLFIRSVFLFYFCFLQFLFFGNCFNPLFIRSVFLLKRRGKLSRSAWQVSIPYSSGQCFFWF